MKAYFWLPALLIVVVLSVGSLRTVLAWEFPHFIKAINKDTRDGYISLGLLAAACFGWGLHDAGIISFASFEAGGVKAEVRGLRDKVATHDQQIEELFSARQYDVFEAENWNLVRTIRELPRNEGFEVEVTLQQQPIPKSLEIFRGVLPVPPNNITGVTGNKVRLLTTPATYAELPLVVQYYPLKAQSH